MISELICKYQVQQQRLESELDDLLDKFIYSIDVKESLENEIKLIKEFIKDMQEIETVLSNAFMRSYLSEAEDGLELLVGEEI